ncbi:MAG: hypothetical protein R6X15_09265 [Pseudomonadota bacterium]
MSTRVLAISALVLWLVTVGVAATMFVGGKTTGGSDGRTAIVLEEAERDLVLAEMRTMLDSVQGIVSGLSEENMEQVSKAAKASGMAIAGDVPPSVMGKLPLEFKQMGMGVHRGFDELSVSVQQELPPDMILGQLGEQLNSCVACHASYQIRVNQED